MLVHYNRIDGYQAIWLFLRKHKGTMVPSCLVIPTQTQRTITMVAHDPILPAVPWEWQAKRSS